MMARSIPTDRHKANSESIVSTNGFVRTRSCCIVRSKQIGHVVPDRNDRHRPEPGEVTDVDTTRAEVRREAAPAAVLLFVVFLALALLSRWEGWALLGFPWWAWLILGVPALVLVLDLVVARRGAGLVRSRQEALGLLFFLVAGNIGALAVLLFGLMTTNTSDLGGGELLATGLAI